MLALFDSSPQVGAMDKGFFETVKRRLGKVNAPTKRLKMADGTLVDSVAHWEGLIEIGGARTHGAFEVFDSRGAWLSGADALNSLTFRRVIRSGSRAPFSTFRSISRSVLSGSKLPSGLHKNPEASPVSPAPKTVWTHSTSCHGIPLSLD